MTHTFKLAHRLARLRTAPVTSLLLLASACTDTKTLEPTAPSNVEATLATAAPALSISNLSARSGKTYRVASNFTANIKPYVDRTYTIQGPIPATLQGLTYIQTANDDKDAFAGSATALSFDVNQTAIVYVAHDDRLSPPSWLTSSFQNTGIDLLSPQRTPATYRVFQRTFARGRVTLGSNVKSPADQNMYFVLVRPTATTPPPSTPTLASVALMPAQVSLAPGGTRQFAAHGRTSSGDSVAAAVTYTATGGSITSGGLYTAGTTTGAFRVIARHQNGTHADTSAVTITASPPPSSRGGYYVTPSGSSSGDGSASRPWDLRTALAHPTRVQVGDTIWLRGGTYSGTFTSSLTGTSAAPIIVRQYPGERATIRGTVAINGANTWYWGFEVANASTGTQDVMGVNAYGPGTRLINLVVHDHSGNGIGLWSEAPNAEVYGSILYNNGFCGSGAGCSSWGHGIYSQNSSGTKLLADNVVFQTFGYGFHIYTENNYLRNFTLDGNVSFNNGMRSGNNFLVGGSTPVENLSFVRNMSYQKTGSAGTWVGRSSTQNRGMAVRDNYLVGGWPTFRLFNWDQATVTGNTFVGWGNPGSMVDQQGSTGGYQWSNNRYYGNSSVTEWNWRGAPYTFSSWRNSTGLGSGDQYPGSRPSGTQVFVRPNRYERGRANVIVYNWNRTGSVSVDLSSVLSVGDRYEVRNAQAFYGSAVVTGTYGGGAITIPVSAVAGPTPIGGWSVTAASTGTDFQVFVVKIQGS